VKVSPLLLSALLIVAAVPSTAAQSRTVATLNEPASLGGLWRFRTGDDPAWSAPSFDDSEWRDLRVPLDWGRQGYDGYSGFAWYRLTLQLPASDPSLSHLAVTLGKVHSAYELYAGGRFIGGVGSLPPSPQIVYDRYGTFDIPPDAIGPDGRLVLALRVWRAAQVARTWEGGPYEGPFLIGTTGHLIRRQLTTDLLPLVLTVVYICAGLYHLFMFRRRRQLREYLWFGVLANCIGIYGLLVSQWKHDLPLSWIALKKIEYVALFLMAPVTLQFLSVLLSIKVPRPVRAYQLSFLALAVPLLVVPGVSPLFATLDVWQFIVLPMLAIICGVTAWKAWRGHPEAQTVVLGIAIFALAAVSDIATDRRWITAPRLAPVGFATFVMVMALSLSNRFSRLFAEVEEANRGLEQKVEERTQALRAVNERLEEMARVDPLTQLANRRAFFDCAHDEMARAGRTGRAFSLVLGDVDHFKRINDQHGHARGDEILVRIAAILRAGIRDVDLATRWGGEEMLLLLVDTDAAGAMHVAGRIREMIASSAAGDATGPQVSMTFGVSMFEAGVSLEALIERADSALYHGKAAGRNRVVLWSQECGSPAGG
jgi:diguanylate cyclase (GGDEF)-like protein